MKKVKSVMLLVLSLVFGMITKAQTVDDIIAKQLDAIGGKDKISQIKSIYMEGITQVMGGDNPTTTIILNGKGFRTESEFNGQKIINVITDKGGWMINPMMGGGDVQDMTAEQFKSQKNQIYVGTPFYNYEAFGTKVALEGKEDGAYKIKVTTSDGIDFTCFIDPTTYYITKMERKGNRRGQDVTMTTTFSDYQKTDFGYVLPHTVKIDFGNFQISTFINSVTINKEIDPKIFDKPKN